MSIEDPKASEVWADADDSGEETWTPSVVLIAMGPNSGTVLEYRGSGITNEIQEAGLYGLDEIGLDDAPQGLSIWEGDYVYEPGYVDGYEALGEGEMHPSGKFRGLTADEWEKLRKGESLW
jgi:hypothetical protein